MRVRASSLNYRDLMVLRGGGRGPTKLGVVPLSDGAGEVAAIGEGPSVGPSRENCPRNYDRHQPAAWGSIASGQGLCRRAPVEITPRSSDCNTATLQHPESGPRDASRRSCLTHRDMAMPQIP
jgi:hypothetical protein